MSVYQAQSYFEHALITNYCGARKNLLGLIVTLDALLPPGEKKENILNALVDTGTDIVHAFVRGEDAGDQRRIPCEIVSRLALAGAVQDSPG